jgi:hypothetical protein
MANPVDPAVLVFAGCAGFSGLFLLVAVANGALHGHGLHLHAGSSAHGGPDVHAAPGGHAPHAVPGGHGHHIGHAGHTAHVQHAGGHGHAGPANAAQHHGHAGAHQSHHAHTAHAGSDGHAAHTAHDAQLHHQAAHSADHAAHDARHTGDHSGHQTHHSDVGERSQSAASTLVQGYWHGFTLIVVRSLNLYAILTFLFYFGVTGLVARGTFQLGTGLVVFFATLIGLAASLVFGAIVQRLFGDTSGLVTLENSRVRGREVKVTRRIRDGGTGEILYIAPGRGTQNLPARSIDGESISVGQSVVVVDVKHGIALVKRVGLSLDTEEYEDADVDEAEDQEDDEVEDVDLEA